MGQFEYQNNHYDGSVSQKNSYTVISLIPTVRFDWFNRRYVRLYSSIGAGFTSIFISKNNYNYNYKNHYYIPWIAYDFTGIGCAFGNRVYGFAEFGFSSGGFARVGLGWRVPNKD